MVEGPMLLRLAREAIYTSLSGGAVVVPDAPWLQEPGAVFVTLRQPPAWELRGCVGSIQADRALGDAVIDAARAAALSDRRFARLTLPELATIRLEISLLSAATDFPVTDEADARRQLDRTRPGVILRCGNRRGVFLPKVWESVEDACEFLGHLKIKAGLPPAFWSKEVELQVFTCLEFAEAGASPLTGVQ